MGMALLGSGVFLVGVFSGGQHWLERTALPDSTAKLLAGAGCFAFFFPWFLCLYCCRHLLHAIRILEGKVESLSQHRQRNP
jgi:TRAP-type C4-dicarboxylate transport system permease small subunit